MITQRKYPALLNEIICTEPSPDVAKALATAAAVTAQGGNGAASGSLGFNGSSAEAAIELAGRSTALLALRDGLFRACEAYANGIIGQDAYSLVLSRYGQIMMTLFLGQDVTSAAGAEGKSAAINAVLQAGGGGGGATTTTTKTPAAAPAKTSGQSSDATQPGMANGPMMVAYHSRAGAELPVLPAMALPPIGASGGAHSIVLAQAQSPAPAAGGDANTGAPSGAKITSGNTNGGTTGSGTQPQSASAAGVSTAAALTLGRMNEDYFHLDNNLLHLLVVSCINEFDVTRLRTPSTTPSPERKTQSAQQTQPAASETFGEGAIPHDTTDSNGLTLAQGGNPFLLAVCNKMTYAAIKTELEAEAKIPPALINPEVAAVQLTASSAKPASPAPAKPKSDPTVLKVQYALKLEPCAGCDPGATDGIAGPATEEIRGIEVPHDPAERQTAGPRDPGLSWNKGAHTGAGYNPRADFAEPVK